MRTLNIVLVVRILFFLLIVVGFFMLAPAFLALADGQAKVFGSFIWPACIMLFFGVLGALLYVNPRSYLGPREGFLLVTLGWLAVSAFGALPFLLSGVVKTYVDAFFETMSGFTTTGASIFTDVEILPRAVLLWRSLTHWLGGMGVIALTVAILPALGVSGLNLLRAETPGPDVDKVTPKLNDTAKSLWVIYIGMTFLQIILFILGGMSIFDAVNHTFATVATGGFSTKNNGFAYWDSPFIHWTATVFMFLAGVNFVVYYQIFQRKLGALKSNSELKAYVLIVLLAILFVSISLYMKRQVEGDFFDSLRIGAFQVVTILTTTGFSIADYNVWPPLAQAAIFMTMFVGGSTGSTAGGIKALRIVALGKLAYHEGRVMLHPRGIFTIRINNKPVRKDLIYPIAGFVFSYIALVLAATIIVSAFDIDMITSFTSVLATLGNIGPGFGKVGPVNNYQFLPEPVKWIQAFLMLLGRLELWTVLVLFMPRFWKR